MEAVALLAGLALAINKTVSVLKAITNGEWRTVYTQVLVWVVGFFGLLLASNADIAEGLAIDGFVKPLSDVNTASLALLAWILGGTGSFLYDWKKARDNSDNAVETRLLASKNLDRTDT
jgi:hypothetical protein